MKHRIKRRLISVLLAIAMLTQLCGGMALAAENPDDEPVLAGTCGESVTWAIDPGNGTLTISGSGPMEDYAFNEEDYCCTTPWYELAYWIPRVVIEEGVTSIGSFAFYDFWMLESVEIPKSVKTISDYAFVGVGQEVECCMLTFGGDAPAFSENAFHDSYPDILYSTTAEGWSSIVTAPEEGEDGSKFAGGWVLWMGIGADGILASGNCGEDDDDEDYDYEDNLTWTLNVDGKLTVTGSGTMCDDPAWQSYRALITEVTLPAGLTNIGKAAFCYTGLTEIAIPDSVTTIGNSAFDGTSLSQVTLPEGLTAIGSYAFAYTDIEAIEIPATVTEIDYGAFLYCSALKTITFLGRAPTFTNKEYNEIFKYVTATVYYPANDESWTGDVMQQYGGTLTWVEQSDTIAPTVTINSPAADTVLKSLYVAFDVSATDDSGIASLVMSYQKGSETVTVNTAPYEINLYTIGDGALEVTFKATDNSGNEASVTQSYTIDIYPDAPTGLSGSSTADGVQLTWTAANDADIYYIYLKAANGGLTSCGFTDANTHTWLDAVAQDGETYTYVVAAERTDTQLISYSDPLVVTYQKPVAPDVTAPVISDVWPETEDNVTLCHDTDVKIAASDETELSRAEVWCTIGEGAAVKLGEGSATDGIYTIPCDLSALSGEAALTYKVYDKAGNCAERSENVIIRPYTAPVTPTNLTAEPGFRNAVLRWSYDGDLQTLKQFRVYACDVSGGNAELLSAVKSYQHTINGLESGTYYFKVTAEDIFGAESAGAIVSVEPETTENTAPVAVIQSTEFAGAVGTAIHFSGVGSTDNDAIASYAWDFGDGETGSGMLCEHTYQEAGSYTVKLTVTDRSGNTNTAQTTVTIYAVNGADATHTLLWVTVRDGFKEDTPFIEGATVQAEAEGYSYSTLTDANGSASLLVPKGKVKLTVLKDGYFASIQEVEESTTVYLRSASVNILDGELKVEDLTYDEIVEAGIDVTAPENQHIVKMETTLQMVVAPSMKGTDPILVDIPVSALFNLNGDCVDGDGWGWHTFTEDSEGTTQPSDTPTVTKPALSIGAFPMGEKYILVVYGEAHWLKEMYNVELLVLNNSYAEEITNCTATLQLPSGLSLADMTDRVQTEAVELGTIGHRGQENRASTAKASWYVRGDVAGEYHIGAEVTGLLGNTPFVQSFTTEETVKVYAGDALHLTISAQNIAYKDEEYHVRYALKNVSDKSLYHLQFGLSGATQFQAIMGFREGLPGEWTRELSHTDFGENGMIQIPEFKPGDTLTIDFTTDVWFNSALGFVDIGPLDIGYYVTDVVHTALEGSTTEIPYTINLIKTGHGQVEKYMWKEIGDEIGGAMVNSAVSLLDKAKFEGEDVAANVVKAFQFSSKASDAADEATGKGKTASVVITLGEGASFGDLFVTLPQREQSIMPLSLRAAAPVVQVMTDAAPENCTINEDGTMTITGDALIFLQAVGTGEAPVTFTTYTEDGDTYRENTYTYTCKVNDTAQTAEVTHVALQGEDTIELDIPAEGTVTQKIPTLLIAENGDFYSGMDGELWTVTGQTATGVTVENGVLAIDSAAQPGTYTIKLDIGSISDEIILILTDAETENIGWIVSFDSKGGSSVPAQTVTNGQPAVKPADPTRSGYSFADWYSDEGCTTSYDFTTAVTTDITLYAKWIAVSPGGSGGGGVSSNTTTKTEKNEDGSTTTTTTNKTTGTVTETTKYPDGSTTTVEIRKDGSSTETIKTSDGTSGVTKTDKDGSVTEVSVKVPSAAADKAEEKNEPVTLPVEVPAADSSEDAVEIKVDVPTGGATVEIPVEDVTSGTVVVIVNADGTEEIVQTSTVSDSGVVVTLDQDATIKVIDNSKHFVDVHPVDHWAEEAIDFISARGMMAGYGNGLFGTDDSITRGQIVTILWRLEGSPVVNYLMQFEDVAAEKYYTEAIRWATSEGIVGGYGNGKFGPDDPITRQQLATMLWRYAQHIGQDVSVGEDTNILSYEDAFDISEYAIPAMQWACGAGIMGGYGNGKLGPNDGATRAQAAAMLQRYCELPRN